MKKKAISLLLVAAMTATMTAGCGDKQEAADNRRRRGSMERYIDCMEPTGRSGYRLVTERM